MAQISKFPDSHSDAARSLSTILGCSSVPLHPLAFPEVAPAAIRDRLRGQMIEPVRLNCSQAIPARARNKAAVGSIGVVAALGRERKEENREPRSLALLIKATAISSAGLIGSCENGPR